jgi:hypothetical protein
MRRLIPGGLFVRAKRRPRWRPFPSLLRITADGAVRSRTCRTFSANERAMDNAHDLSHLIAHLACHRTRAANRRLHRDHRRWKTGCHYRLRSGACPAEFLKEDIIEDADWAPASPN